MPVVTSILLSSPRNWRGASMVAAAKSNNKSTPSNNYKTNSFYGSPADSSLPPTLLSSGERSGANKSAKRMLVLDSAESDDFLPSPNFRYIRADEMIIKYIHVNVCIGLL